MARETSVNEKRIGFVRSGQGRRMLSLLLCALLCCGVLSPQSAFAEMEPAAEDTLPDPAAMAQPASDQAETASEAGPVLLDEAELNQWMDSFVASNNLAGPGKDFSVGFTYTATGESWYYNADVFMYSASLYKVPVAMLMAEKEAAGELNQDSIVLGTTLQYLESTALTYSNNDSGHAMVDYLGGTYAGKCSDMTIAYTDLPEDYFVQDFFDNSYYTARYMTQVMTTLWKGGEERFPHVIEYLRPAQPDAYLNISLKGKYELAQKYGSYQEPNGNENNHIAAIVYTPNPVIITVMTRNVGDYQMRMAEIGTYLTDYAQELDSRYLNWQQQESLRLEAEALAQAAQEAQESVTEESQPAEEPADQMPAAPGEPSGEDGQPMDSELEETAQEALPVPASAGSKVVLLAVVIGALLLILTMVLLLHRKRRSQREREEERTPRRTGTGTRAGKSRGEGEYRPRH